MRPPLPLPLLPLLLLLLPAAAATWWRAELLHSACGGDATCMNCTTSAAEAACVAATGCVALFALNAAPGGACSNASDARGDWALCGQVLGPVAGDANCFVCRGPAFMCS